MKNSDKSKERILSDGGSALMKNQPILKQNKESERGDIQTRPIKPVSLLKFDPKSPGALSKEEVDELLKGVKVWF